MRQLLLLAVATVAHAGVGKSGKPSITPTINLGELDDWLLDASFDLLVFP